MRPRALHSSRVHSPARSRAASSPNTLWRGLLSTVLLLLVAPGLTLALSPTPALLTVRVMDAETGSPLNGATVRVDDGRFAAATSERGEASFPRLGAGDVMVTVSHLGYAPQTLAVTLHAGMPRHLLVSLTPRPIVAEGVTVTATSDPASYRIDGRALRESSWRDVAEAIRSVPGVQVVEEGGWGGRSTVTLRGSRADQVRVEVDGVPLNDGSGTAADLSVVPIHAVASIEVDPRVQPGAPGGRVSIRTLRASSPSTEWTAGMRAASSATGAARAGIHRQVAGIDLALHVRALRSDGDFPYTDESGRTATRHNNDRERLSATVRGETVRGNWSLDGTVHLDGVDKGSPAPLYQPPTPAARIEERRGALRLAGRRMGADGSYTTLALALSGERRQFTNPVNQTDPVTGQTVHHLGSDIEDEDLRGMLNASHTLPRWAVAGGEITIRGGVETGHERYRSQDHLANGATLDRVTGTIHRSWVGGELHGRASWRPGSWSILPHAHLRADLHLDRANAAGLPWAGGETLLAGRAGLSATEPSGHLVASVDLGLAEQPPSFTHRFLSETVFALGNPNLLPERIRELSGGLAYTRQSSGNRKLALSLRGFLRETDDLIVWRRTWRGQHYPDNLARARARGLEAALSLGGMGLLRDLRAACTVQRVVNATPGSVWEGRRIPFQPDLYGHLGARVAIVRPVQLLADLHVSGRRYTSESNLDPISRAGGGLAPYATLDLHLRGSWALSRYPLTLQVRAGVDNATGEEYALLDRMPMPGRVWSLGLSLSSRESTATGLR